MPKQYFIRPISLLFAALLALAAAALISGCAKPPEIPEQYGRQPNAPSIFPDYVSVTIPPNIAPLNFRIEEEGDDFVTEISGRGGQTIAAGGKSVRIPERAWKQLLSENLGQKITFTVYVRRDQEWSRFEPIEVTVSPDRVDPYLTYRRIEPGYIIFGRIRLEERCLENFKTRPFFDNAAFSGSCANCHCCQSGNPNRSLFHVRGENTGTMLRWDGKLKKLDTAARSGFSMTYPAWHPTLPLIAYSSNNTRQCFHSLDLNKIEVFDSFSDLMLYDVEKDAIIPVLETEDLYETFPAWGPDGAQLFCSVAKLKTSEDRSGTRKESAVARANEMMDRHKEIRYSLVRMRFDPETYSFSEPEVLLDAEGTSSSYVHSRVSPDGRFLVYVKADYGTFPIWHHESDLWLLDLKTGENRPLEEVNSRSAESVHSWDSSGRWLVFSSRRGTGQFTRTYFTHFDAEGNCTKPFLLPQESPAIEESDRYSQNLPELMSGPIPDSGGAVNRAVRYTKAVKPTVAEPKR